MSKQLKLNHFLEFVDMISTRPGMFMINNIEDLSLMIFGYRNGCRYEKEVHEKIEKLMEEFKIYINIHYETNEDLDWARLIRFHCVNDISTLDFFKIKFTEFLVQSEWKGVV